jgi:hypothetical protein
VVYSRINFSSVSDTIIGLSFRSATILTIKKIYITINKFPLKEKGYNETIMKYQISRNLFIIYEDPNYLFSSFLCTFLNILQYNFLVK